MIMKAQVKAQFGYANLFKKKCTAAEHAVAVQAERDSRPYIPQSTGKLKSSGKVKDNVIVWDEPYARVIYFGNVYVDPKYKKGGFPYPNRNVMRSRKGIKKINSGRKFNIKRGTAGWFYDAKKKNVGKWLRIAEEELNK